MQTEAPGRSRQSRRFRSCCVSAVVQPADGAELRSPGQIRFLDVHGLIVETERLFEQGTALLLRIASTSENQSVAITVSVAEVNRLAGGKWGLSCRFPGPINVSRLRAFLD